MCRSKAGGLLLAVFFLACVLPMGRPEAQQASRAQALIEEHLYGGKLEAGEKALRELVASAPSDAEAQFALGGVLLVRAVERFGQSMYRHGLQAPRDPTLGPPLFNLPLALNPSPEPLGYEALRAILARLVQDLDAAEAELARVGDRPVQLTVDIARIRLDLDANGVADEREKLSAMVASLAWAARRRASTPPGAESFPVGFDLGDVYWLRGYANLMAISAEFLLAHDFRTTFDSTFHLLFPRAGLPFSRLLREPQPVRPGQMPRFDMDPIFDFVAFIHLLHWDVVEPQRMASIHGRLKSVVALNRKTWAAVRAETDNDNEWLPGPGQKGVLDLPVTEDMITSWLAAIDELEAVLDGRLLAPHPRFGRGVNVKRVFTEPRQFDLVLWITGHGVLPYLEDGPLLDGRAWNDAQRVFRGQLFFYAFWFN
jgi:hypothetical protein